CKTHLASTSFRSPLSVQPKPEILRAPPTAFGVLRPGQSLVGQGRFQPLVPGGLPAGES
ncbi:unnamed protein product, partial [Phaeothamnion confervicola]